MHKKRIFLTLTSVFLFLATILTACQFPGAQGTQDNAAETGAAQTVNAAYTQTEVALVAKEATQVAQTQTALAQMPTDTPAPTDTPMPTPTYTQEAEQDNCNFADFVEDVTVEDRSVFDENETFEKIWRFENIGECTWETNYQVVFHSGYQMSAPEAVNLPEAVAPSETIDISLDMIAPNSPGVYTGYWMFQSDEGDLFGVGDDGDTPFWVRIKVTEDDENVVYNFAENYCDAGWESSVEEDIQCPSKEDFDQGFVQDVEMPELEDGKTYDEPAILAYPDSGKSGYMVGRYPEVAIEDGDHFRATIGCQYGAEDCNVTYTLRVAITGEGLEKLGQWREVYEGQFYPIDVDLSEYAGMDIQIVLSTIAADDTGENYALWLDPRIVRNSD